MLIGEVRGSLPQHRIRWRGGWERRKNGKIMPKQGGRLAILAKIFAARTRSGTGDPCLMGLTARIRKRAIYATAL
jgi:hypothetical protein